MKLRILLCLLIVLLVNKMANANKYISIGVSNSEKCVNREVIKSSPDSFVVKYSIQKIKTNDINANGEVFLQLNLDDSNCLQNIGEPALPIIIQHIGLPSSSSFEAKVIEDKWTNIPIEKVYPAQLPVIGINRSDSLIMSDIAYNGDLYEKELLVHSETMTWNGQQNVFVRICPFKYYPSTNILSVLSEFTLSIKFIPSINSTNTNYNQDRKFYSIFDNTDYFEGFSQRVSLNSNNNNNNNYLIIIGNIPEIENSDILKEFRRWKAIKGFKTKVVSTSVIGSDSTSIKNYILQQYQEGVRYVLFVGDHTKIPIPTFIAKQVQSDHPVDKSDYWYGCMDGVNDYQGDIPIGRFSTNTLTDFTNMVNKTIKYESLYHNWANNVLLTANTEVSLFQVPLQNIYNTYGTYMNFSRAFAAPISSGGTASTILDVIDYINSGMNLVTVNAHGNAGGFWLFDGNNSTLNYTYVSQLNNDTYPVFIVGACCNGDFTNTYSILNYFCRSNHCTSAYIGGAVPVYTVAWGTFIQKLYECLFINGIYHLGDLLLAANNSLIGYGNVYVDNAISTICGGDPTLELWTENQCVFDNVELSLYGDSLVVSNSNATNYDINIITDEFNYQTKYTSSGNTITIPLLTSNFDIAINKHGYIPYIVHINIEDNYIQRRTIEDNHFYMGTPLSIGYDVTELDTYGNVIFESGSNVQINKGNGVIIKNGFECKQGATFSIK